MSYSDMGILFDSDDIADRCEGQFDLSRNVEEWTKLGVLPVLWRPIAPSELVVLRGK